MTEKRCYRCKETKPIAQFSRHSGRPDGYRAECQPCSRAERKAWYAGRGKQVCREYRRKEYYADLSASRLNVRQKNYRFQHGISLEEADALIAKQGGFCALCGEPMEERGIGKRKAVYDHDHTTGAHRAMIHSNCNCLLGFANDDKELLRKAIVYLETHNAR